MADRVTKFLYQTAADLSGAKDFVAAQKKIEEALKSVGKSLDNHQKAVGQTSTVSGVGAKAVLSLTQVFKNSNGTFDQITAKFRNVNGSLKVIPGSVSVVTKSFNSLASQSNSLGQNISNLISRAALTIPVWFALRAVLQLLASGITSSLKSFIDFQFTLAQVRVVANDTEDSVNRLGVEALRLATKFGIAFSELGDGLVTFAQQGFRADEILTLLGPTLEFALVSGRKFGEVVQDEVAIMASFNLTADKIPQVLDSITAAQLKFSITTGQLAAGLRKLSPVTAAMGISFSQTEGLLISVQEQTRQSGEAVATALESIFGRLQSVDTVGAIQSLIKVPLFLDQAGKATEEFTGRVRPTNEILAILSDRFRNSSEAQRAQLAVMLGGRTRFSEASALLNNYGTSIDGTLTSLFSFNATQTASNILLETTKIKIEKLKNEFLELANAIRDPALKVLNAGIDLASFTLKTPAAGLLGGTSSALGEQLNSEKRKEIEINEAIERSITNRTKAVGILSDSYKELIRFQEEFSARESSARSSAELIAIQKQKASIVATIKEKINSKDSKSLSKEVPTLKGNTLEDLQKELEPFVKQNNKALTSEIEQRKVLREGEERKKETLNQIKNIEVSLTAEGKSKIAIVRQQIKLLEELSKKNGGLFSEEEQTKLKQLKIERDEFLLKQQLALQDIENENTLKRAVAFGENDLEIQARRVQYARERAIATGDETEFLKESLNLTGLINDKIAEGANKLKQALAGGVSDFVSGNLDTTSFVSNLSTTIRSSFSQEIGNSVSGLFLKGTGLGDIFGKLTVGLQGAFSGITRAHLAGAQIAAPILTQAIIAGAQGGAGSLISTSSGFGFRKGISKNNDKGFLGGILGSFSNPGIAGSIGALGLGALSGISGGPFGSTGGNIAFGAIQGIATAINPVLGTAVGLAGGLFGLFKKPKKTVDIQETHKEFQVASRIDVTNRKLDVVNRNLVALKSSFDTFVLPDSAYYGTKGNIEDQFSINQRRGLV